MAMSKKHYTTIASILRKWYVYFGDDNPEATTAIDLITDDLAVMFAADNPNFDHERFMAAVMQGGK